MAGDRSGSAMDEGLPSGAAAVWGVVVATIMVVLPMFLLAAVAVLIRAELQFDEAALGISVSMFFGATALSAVPGGWVAEHFGARRALTIGTMASAGCLAGVGFLAHSWITLTAFLILGGAGNGFAQPAANLALARAVNQKRQGIAFGVKQSAIPVANLIAGIALPAVALTLGWRWAFMGAAAAAFVVAIIAPRAVGRSGAPHRTTMGGKDVPIGPLILLAGAVATGSAAAISLGAFLVESAITGGLSPPAAGLLLSLGGLTGAGARLLAGWLADRRDGGHLIVVAWMLVGGAAGFGFLAASDGRPLFVVVGTVLGFGLAWGWPGLCFYAIVRLNPNAPAAASSIAQVGGAAGGVLGPLAFGMIVASRSYQAAWTTALFMDLLAAALMVLGRRVLIRRRTAPAATPVLPPTDTAPVSW